MLPIFVIAAFLGIVNAYLPASFENGQFNFGLRMIGGKNASIEEFPHQVYLQFEQYEALYEIGNGAIISPNWVVTVAHPMIQPDLSLTSIRAGSAFRFQGTLHEVDKIIVHENFCGGGVKELPKNNIALIRVKNPFKYDEAHKAVELFEANEPVKLGYAQVASLTFRSKHLQVADVMLIDYERCNSAYKLAGSEVGVPKGYLCSTQHSGPTLGDDGAPLTQSGRLAGFTTRLYWDTLPILYTEIAYYRDWIKRHTGV